MPRLGIAGALLVAGSLLLALLGDRDGPAPPPTRPSFLIVVADDWSWPHASILGDPVVETPSFDRIAREGLYFSHAFVSSPSCTASRGSILSGQASHRLAGGANLAGALPPNVPVFPDLLEQAGYRVGYAGKGWSPGRPRAAGWPRNPAGPRAPSFARFLEQLPPNTPFCYWFGSLHPHRPYAPGRQGLHPDQLHVPPFLPDLPEVRNDLLDYYHAVGSFDGELSRLLRQLDASGRAQQTMVVVTSDNGMPFPRAKANLYDPGTRVPFAIRWPGHVDGQQRRSELISLTDLAPTILEAAGLPVPAQMTGRSLLPALLGTPSEPRPAVFLERERHSTHGPRLQTYPSRAIRTNRWLYIRNYLPQRWPAGDPFDPAGMAFADIDRSPSKMAVLSASTSDQARLRWLSVGHRPYAELYDVTTDPWQIHDLAGSPELVDVQAELDRQLRCWLEETDDPHARGEHDHFDRYENFNPAAPHAARGDDSP